MEIPKEYWTKCDAVTFRTMRASKHEISEAEPKHKALPLSPKEEFNPGDRIFHPEFGLGEIQDAYEGSMGLTYKILFDRDHSLKTLVAKFAVLNKI